MGLLLVLKLLIGLCFILLNVNIAKCTSNASTESRCVVWIPDATEYIWVYYGATPASKSPTNSAGTRVETLDITTGGFETEGKWIHLTSKTTLAFPTNYRAGAAEYNWASGGFKTGSGAFFGFFSTVYSLAQEPHQTVTADRDGLVYGLHTITTNLGPISRFQQLYPEIRQFKTCIASSQVFEAEQPPGVLNVAPKDSAPTLPLLVSSSQLVFAPTSTESSFAQARTSEFSTKLVPASSDSRISGRSSEEAARPLSSSLDLLRGKASSEFSASTFPAPVMRSSTAIPSATLPPSSPNKTTLASSKVSSTSHSDLHKSPEIPQVSVVSGTILVDGQTLGFSTTLTLGSGSTVTELSLKTNSFGQTVVVGGELTKAQVKQGQSSDSTTSSKSLRPTASPARFVSASSVSTMPSNGATTSRPHLTLLAQFWAVIWIMHLSKALMVKACT